MSVKLDRKDRNILYQLDLDARQNNTKIAKKVKLSKDAVGYRIKQLEKKNIIRGYSTIIDSSRIGYSFYRVFFNLIDLNPAKLDELIDFLKKEPNVWWIAKVDGAWNFAFASWFKSDTGFRDFYNNRLCSRFRQNIKERLVCPITAYKNLNRTYLTEDRAEEKIGSVGGRQKTDHDDIDLQILNILSNNARAHLIDIGKELNLDSMTIHHRIKKLEQKGVIQGYKADLNFTLLKRDFYSVKINLINFSQFKEIEEYIKTIPEVTAITEAIGSYDIEFDLEVKDSRQYFKIIEDLENKFESIREILYFRVLKNHKILYMPEIKKE